MRTVHRGLPDARADDDQRVRAGRQQPRATSSTRSPTCWHRCCPAWSSRRTRCASARTRVTTTAARCAARTVQEDGVVIAFWILAPIMVICALGLLFARKAVHCALLLAVVMISLAVLYAVQDAPFLFAVQIIVYTGAILMLFLFVLMLVGVDSSDSVVETIRGPAALRRPGRAALRCHPRDRPGPGVGRRGRRTRRGQRGRQRPGDRPGPVHPLRLRLRGHLGAADHRRAGRDGAGPPGAADPQARPRATSPRSGCGTTPTTASTSARCPRPVSSPGTTPSTPRPCCRTGTVAQTSISRVLMARGTVNQAPGSRRPGRALRR